MVRCNASSSGCAWTAPPKMTSATTKRMTRMMILSDKSCVDGRYLRQVLGDQFPRAPFVPARVDNSLTRTHVDTMRLQRVDRHRLPVNMNERILLRQPLRKGLPGAAAVA